MSGGVEGSVAWRGTWENGVLNGRRDEGKEEEEKRRGRNEWRSGEVGKWGSEGEQGQGSGAGGTLRFAVSGAGRPFEAIGMLLVLFCFTSKAQTWENVHFNVDWQMNVPLNSNFACRY